MVISVGFSVVAQIISIPLSLGTSLLSTVIAPTGSLEPGAIASFIGVQLIGQAGILLVQCIALVVQSTSAVLVYVDARMRVEGLDHDLASYVEARDAGVEDLPDPYLVGIGRTIAPVQPWGAPANGGAGARRVHLAWVHGDRGGGVGGGDSGGRPVTRRNSAKSEE